MIFHDIGWYYVVVFDSRWYSMIFYDILWYAMILSCFLKVFDEFDGIRWYSMIFDDLLRFSSILWYRWYSMIFGDVLWYSLIFCSLPLQENQRLEPPQAQPMRSLSALPPRGSPLEVAASLCILTDGTCPETLDSVSAEDWISGVYCGQCAAGPWHGKKSFFQHIVRKHAVRNVLNSKTCPLCTRAFTEVSACRRHVKNQSCGTIVNNHGAAGAIAGLQHRARAISDSASRLAHPNGRASFHGAASSCRGQLSERSQAETPSVRGNQRQWQHGSASEAADCSNASAHEGCQPARQRPSRARSMELPHIFAQQRERLGQATAGSNANLEVAGAGSRSSPSRSSAMDGGRHSGASSSAGRRLCRQTWQVSSLPREFERAARHGEICAAGHGQRNQGSQSLVEDSPATDQPRWMEWSICRPQWKCAAKWRGSQDKCSSTKPTDSPIKCQIGSANTGSFPRAKPPQLTGLQVCSVALNFPFNLIFALPYP